MIKQYNIYKKFILQNQNSNKLNFIVDGREHYVYRITDYTRTEKENYYGSHTPPKNKKYNSLKGEFWTYKTSSKYNIINENKKENYKVKIIKVFDNPGDMIIYESFLHQYFNVKENINFWNKSNQTPFGFSTTGLTFTNPNKGLTYEQIFGKVAGEKARNNKIGSKNPKAKNIKLFDNNDILICEYDCINYFYEYCKDNNMPSRLYNKRCKERKQTFVLARNTSIKFRKFKDWYVIVE